MDVREKLLELLEEIPHPQRLYPDLYVDRLIAHGVTVQDNTEISEELLKQLRIAPITILQEEPTIEVVQEWISVKDRLPEVATSHNTRWDKSTDSIRVLCACVQADGKKMVKEGYCKVYSDGFIHWKIPGTIHSVTHWHYLPQPPKGE